MKMKRLSEELKKQCPTKNWELVVGMPDDGDAHFSPSGCDLIDTLALDVQEVECLLIRRNKKTGEITKAERFTARVCHMVLDAYHNGTEYFLNERGDWIADWELK